MSHTQTRHIQRFSQPQTSTYSWAMRRTWPGRRFLTRSCRDKALGIARDTGHFLSLQFVLPKWDLESVFFVGRNRSPNCLLLNVVCRNCRWQLILITEDGPIEDSIWFSFSQADAPGKLLDCSDTISIHQPCGVFDVVWCTQSLIPPDKIDFWECSEPGSCG